MKAIKQEIHLLVRKMDFYLMRHFILFLKRNGIDVINLLGNEDLGWKIITKAEYPNLLYHVNHWQDVMVWTLDRWFRFEFECIEEEDIDVDFN